MADVSSSNYLTKLMLTNGTLPSGVLLSRSSVGTYTDSTGTVVSASIDIARFNYNPSTLFQRFNLFSYSEDFSKWTDSDEVTFVSVSTTAPDGTSTAYTATPNTNNASHDVEKYVTVTGGLNYTFSVYVKSNGYNYIQMNLGRSANVTDAGQAIFDLSSGTIYSNANGLATIVVAPNSWYRCSITGTKNSVSESMYGSLYIQQVAGTSTYTGDGTSGIYIWGAQLEQSSTITAYIKTTDSIAYDPSFGSSPYALAKNGLLIEPQRQNIILYSTSTTTGQWGKSSAAVLSYAVSTAPDGTTTSVKMGNSGAGTTVYTFWGATTTSVSYVSGTIYTASCWLKSDSTSTDLGNIILRLHSSAFTASTSCIVNLLLGIVVSIEGTPSNYGIQKYPNGWYRVWVTKAATATISTFGPLVWASTKPTDSSKYVLIWGAQLEEGYGPTSLISTTGAPVTRAADVTTFSIPTSSGLLQYTYWYSTRITGTLALTTNTSQKINTTSGSYTIPYTLNSYWLKNIDIFGLYSYNFLLGTLPAGTTFTRASSGMYCDSTGLLVSATTDVARFSYDATTISTYSILKASNLLTYPEDFRNTADAGSARPWIYTRATISINLVNAPDETLTADKLVEDTSAATTHFISQGYTFVSGTTYVLSIFAKALERPAIELRFLSTSFGSNTAINFNLTSGVKTVSAGVPLAYDMETYPNGWYRCYIVATATASVSDAIWIRLTNGSTVSYDGDGTSGIYIWGVKLEATNYLPYMKDFSAIAWAKTGSSITQTTILNNLSVYKLIEDTSTGYHALTFPSYAIVSGSTYIVSFYAYQGERTRIRIDGRSSQFGTLNTVIDISTKTVVSNTGYTSVSMTNDNNGMIKVELTAISTGTVTDTPFFIYLVQTASVISYTGNGTSGIYILGASTNTTYVSENISFKGLVYEPSTTNVIFQSNDFRTNAESGLTTNWSSHTGVAVPTINAAVAPDGTTTASRLTEDTSTAQRSFRSSTITMTSGTVFTGSVYVKPDSNRLGITLYVSGTGGWVTDFNLSTMVATSVTAGGVAIAGVSNIDVLPNGWYRLSQTTIFSSAQTGIRFYWYFSNNPADGNAAYTGDGTSGIYAWGAQLESGYRSSVILTSGATATRAGDILTFTNPTTALYTFDNNTSQKALITPGTYTIPTTLSRSDILMIQETGNYVYDLTTLSLPSGITLTRASSGNYYNSSGVMTSAAIDVTRYSYNSKTLEVLTAGRATNLLTYTEDFRDTATAGSLRPWAYIRASVLSDVETAPDGTMTADKLICDTTASATHVVQQTYAAAGSTTYTYSLYLKRAEYRYVLFQVGSFAYQTNPNAVYVDLQDGDIKSATDLTRTTFTYFGNGWYRVSTTITTIPAGGNLTPIIYLSEDGITSSYSGDGYSGVYLWGAKFETGSVATPYVSNSYMTQSLNGLIVEAAATNLQIYSEAFDNASGWTLSRATISANAAVAPDGNTTADKLVDDSTPGLAHYIFSPTVVSVVSGTIYTVSVYVKAAGRTQAAISFLTSNGAFSSALAIFNLTLGTIVSDTTEGATITPLANSWYRITAKKTALASVTCRYEFLSAVNGNIYYNGDGTSGIYLWGAQFEAGSKATSYIATTSASASRSADVVTYTVPAGIGSMSFTFDDNSAQTLPTSPGTYTIPTSSLNRNIIKSIHGGI